MEIRCKSVIFAPYFYEPESYFEIDMAIEKQIIECVPNFSEGRDMNVIKQITNEIEAVKGVRCSIAVPGRLRRGDKLYLWETC